MPLSPANDASSTKAFQEKFVGILLTDAIFALQCHERSDGEDQRERRALIRTLFAAVEGLAWNFREHVSQCAESVGALSDEETLALSELTYQVSEQGKVISQPRFISTVAAIRLSSRIAVRMSPDLELAFDTMDWEKFRCAVSTRNRLAHPKGESDLTITAADVADCITAFFWLPDMSSRAMEAVNAATSSYLKELRQVLDELKTGDREVLDAYRHVLNTVKE